MTVPRTALIRLDAAGEVDAAATNTGCAPRNGDDFYVIAFDGSVLSDTAINNPPITYPIYSCAPDDIPDIVFGIE